MLILRRFGRLLALFVVLAGLLVVAPAAQAATKPYSVVLTSPASFPASPATIPAGQTSTILATYTNLTGQQQLGSSDLAAPAGLTIVSASVPAPGTVTVSSNTARIRNLSLAPGNSVTVTLSVAAAPSCTTSNPLWPIPTTKQSNDFNGPPGNNLTFITSSSDLSTTVTGSTCILRFVNAPADAGTDLTVTSAPFDTTGPPVAVEVIDSGGTRITSSSAPVTLAITANPGGGFLSGTTTVNASSGLARFTTPSITRAGVGYTLTASSPSMTSVTSAPITIEDPTYGVVAANADDTQPATLPAGDAVQRKLVITTLTGGRTLRSADIVVPTGVSVTAASVPAPGTATISGSTVRLRNLSVSRRASVTATLSLRVPCTAGSLSWSTTAKSTADFSGTADILLDPAQTTLPTALTGSCSLSFTAQPADARTGQVITSTPFNTPAGLPVAVEMLGTSGQRVVWSTASITAALATGSPLTPLSGTTTVAATAGVASFSLALGAPGSGYSLSATSSGITGATSSPTFSISETSTACTEDVSCTTNIPLSGGKSNVDVTAIQGPGTDTDTGFLTTSLNFGGPLDCAGYTELLNDIVVISYIGEARTKRVVATIDKRIMNATADNGAAGLQVCYGAPAEFDTRPGTPLLSVNTDYVQGPYPAPEYKGLLPDCGKSAFAPDGTPVASAVPPCVVSRNKTGAGDGVIESLWPSAPTDPRSRM